MQTFTHRSLARRIVGLIFLYFSLFWLLCFIIGLTPSAPTLPVSYFFGMLISMYGILAILSKLNMVLDRSNSSAGLATLLWLLIFLIVRSVLDQYADVLSGYPVWYHVGTILFFIVSPLIDLLEMIKELAHR